MQVAQCLAVRRWFVTWGAAKCSLPLPGPQPMAVAADHAQAQHSVAQPITRTRFTRQPLTPQKDMDMKAYKEWYAAMKHAMPDHNMVLYDVSTGQGTGGAPIVWARYSKVGRFGGCAPYVSFPSLSPRCLSGRVSTSARSDAFTRAMHASLPLQSIPCSASLPLGSAWS